MNYPGSVCLLVCSLAVLIISLALPWVTSDIRQSERPRGWAVFVALALIVAAVFRVRPANPSQTQILDALLLSAMMLAGVGVKWLTETLAQKKLTLHEPVLFCSLFAAPLSVVFGGRIFAANPTPGVLLLWFLNGYFWHALFSDIERLLTKDRIIIRRREPPYPAPAALGPDKSVRA